MPDVFAEFKQRFSGVMTQETARMLEDNLKLIEAVIEEIHGIDSGRSMAKAIADQLLADEAVQTQQEEIARRIPIDERYYRPRQEPWLPGEYIPRPYYEAGCMGDLDHSIDQQRMLGRPLTWCPVTGEPTTW